MNPMNVAQARTARLNREAQPRVAFSTSTGDEPSWTRPQFRPLPMPRRDYLCCEDCG